MRLDNASGAFPAFQAMQPNGRLFVPTTYVQTGSEQAVQLDATTKECAMKFIPEVDITVSSVSLRIAAVGTQGNLTVGIYNDHADGTKPDKTSAVSSEDSVDSGSGAGWIRRVFTTAAVLQRGEAYWLNIKPAASTDASLSDRRWNVTQGSMFPDSHVITKTTTDNWTTPADATQNSRPAMLNAVLNSSANHVPPLIYGRHNGQYVYLPGAGMYQIPAAGISLACDALTNATLYHVYIYDNAGTLTLEASATAPTLNEGILVKTGATSRRYLALIYPKTLISTYQGPVDCMDSRLVKNYYNKIAKPFGKLSPYGDNTSSTPTQTETGFNGSATEWRIESIFEDRTALQLEVSVNIAIPADKYAVVGIAMDSSSGPNPFYFCKDYSTNSSAGGVRVQHDVSGTVFPSRGYHYFLPIQNGNGSIFYFMGDTYIGQATFQGLLFC